MCLYRIWGNSAIEVIMRTISLVSIILATLSISTIAAHAGPVGQHFAAARGHFGHEGHFRARRFVPGLYDYDYGCSYGYPYYALNHSCYPPTYY